MMPNRGTEYIILLREAKARIRLLEEIAGQLQALEIDKPNLRESAMISIIVNAYDIENARLDTLRKARWGATE